jgi:hypothetical protein
MNIIHLSPIICNKRKSVVMFKIYCSINYCNLIYIPYSLFLFLQVKYRIFPTDAGENFEHSLFLFRISIYKNKNRNKTGLANL